MPKKGNTIKYDDAYISYVKTGESAAVFITRDIVDAVNTKGKWIDILSTKGNQKDNGQWDFREITVELFPRKEHPVYPKNASVEDMKYLTWQTAQRDIGKQRRAGEKGIRYRITLKLENKNRGKFRIVEKIWDKKFEQYVPRDWGMNPDREIRERKVPMKPHWEYKIISVKRLD